APPQLKGSALIDRMIAHWQERLDQVLPDRPDLIVLPEMCDRYSGQNREQMLEYRALRGDHIFEFLQGVARKHNCYIVYASGREAKDGSWRNSAIMLNRSGEVAGEYNKNHVVIGETTNWDILCGAKAPIIECDF